MLKKIVILVLKNKNNKVVTEKIKAYNTNVYVFN